LAFKSINSSLRRAASQYPGNLYYKTSSYFTLNTFIINFIRLFMQVFRAIPVKTIKGKLRPFFYIFLAEFDVIVTGFSSGIY